MLRLTTDDIENRQLEECGEEMYYFSLFNYCISHDHITESAVLTCNNFLLQEKQWTGYFLWFI